MCLCSGLPANIQLDIDGDRETERIYSLFSSYMSKLEKMQGEAGLGGASVTALEQRRLLQAGGCSGKLL